jgi:hypothetical protein
MMNITADAFESIEKSYWKCSSWGLWADQGNSVKSNVGDLSVFDFSKAPQNFDRLHANFFVVGLNISTDTINEKFQNFHSSSPRSHDYKLRYAFMDTPVWGCYMTDILKDYPEVDSSKVKKSLADKSADLNKHFYTLSKEIEILNAERAIFIGLGGLATDLLRIALPKSTKIIGVRHYSDWRIGKEQYRSDFISSVLDH